jgi:hypothetical protein
MDGASLGRTERLRLQVRPTQVTPCDRREEQSCDRGDNVGTTAKTAPRSAPRHARGASYSPLNQPARPAGFEPATRCLEGSCSVRLSYGRPKIILHGECHARAT